MNKFLKHLIDFKMYSSKFIFQTLIYIITKVIEQKFQSIYCFVDNLKQNPSLKFPIS